MPSFAQTAAVVASGCCGAIAASAASSPLSVPLALAEVDVIFHSPLPVLSSANEAGQGKPPDGCIVFNPAYIPASPPQLNTSGLLVRMCCGTSCVGHGSWGDVGDHLRHRQPQLHQQPASGGAGVSSERIGFAPCDLDTGVCGDVLPDFNLDPTVDAEDPRAFVYDGAYYLFYYRGAVLPGTSCIGSQCTVALAKTTTPLDAASWKPLATLNWHRNGCCIMRARGQRSYCMWGEGPGPFPGLGISCVAHPVPRPPPPPPLAFSPSSGLKKQKHVGVEVIFVADCGHPPHPTRTVPRSAAPATTSTTTRRMHVLT
jgi:hypothetical protein